MSFVRRVSLLAVLALLLMVGGAVLAQGDLPDSDGDTIPDEFDACPDQAGLPENAGCPAGVLPPDADGDTVPDIYDNCADVVGEPQFGGCPDTDGDQIDDSFDGCPALPGLPQNNGCPIENPQPTEFDRDGDLIDDVYDGCPDQIGSAYNQGCPNGVQPIDTDGDGNPDYNDFCPDVPGTAFDGCPDTDGDQVPDAQDICPSEPGSYDFAGCAAAQYDVTLPANRAPIDATNVANIAQIGRVVFAGNQFVMAEDAGILLARDYLNGVAIYDNISTGNLSPRLLPLGSGYLADMGRTGVYIEIVDNFETQLSTIFVSNQATGADLVAFEGVSLPFPISKLVVSPDGSTFATGHGSPAFYEPEIPGPAILWNTSTGEQIAVLEHDGAVTQLAFTPDGSQLATYGSGQIHIWELASATEITRFATEVTPYGLSSLMEYSPDGSQLAVISGATLRVFETASYSLLYETVVFQGNLAGVGSFAYSNDGNLIAAGAALFADGGIPPNFTADVALVDATSGTLLTTLIGPSGYAISVGFSPDNTFVLSTASSQILLWGIPQ